MLVSGGEHNFRKQTSDNVGSLNVPYDYRSVMHYGKKHFSKNGKITIETKDPAMQDIIGERSGFSKLDILQLNLLYQCPGKNLFLKLFCDLWSTKATTPTNLENFTLSFIGVDFEPLYESLLNLVSILITSIGKVWAILVCFLHIFFHIDYPISHKSFEKFLFMQRFRQIGFT